MMKKVIPRVIFKARVRDENIKGGNPYRWQDISTDDYFKGKKVILFSLPGAFTPTCSTYQLPEFEKLYKKFRGIGLDVTEPEPLVEDHLLYSATNVLITPHIAGLSDNNRKRGFNLIKLNIHRYLHNENLLNIVDKKKEY